MYAVHNVVTFVFDHRRQLGETGAHIISRAFQCMERSKNMRLTANEIDEIMRPNMHLARQFHREAQSQSHMELGLKALQGKAHIDFSVLTIALCGLSIPPELHEPLTAENAHVLIARLGNHLRKRNVHWKDEWINVKDT